MRCLVSALLILALAACGGEDGPAASSEIDRDAWRADLAEIGLPNPDLDALEDITRKMCSNEVKDLALGLSLEGSRPDSLRISMNHVCPDDAHKVDDALGYLEDATSDVDEACALESSMRTEDQQMLAEAMGC